MFEELFRNPLHLWVLLLVVMLVFGGKRVSDLGGAMGKGIRDFRHALKDEDEPKANAAPVVFATGTCPACGFANEINARFCNNCGRQVATA